MAKKVVITENESEGTRIFVDDHEMTDIGSYKLEGGVREVARLTLTVYIVDSLTVEIAEP